MSKRFSRFYWTRQCPIYSIDGRVENALDAHSEAIEGLEERTDKLGRNLDMVERKLIAVDAALTERVAALEGADNAPSYVLAVLERRMARLEGWKPLLLRSLTELAAYCGWRWKKPENEWEPCRVPVYTPTPEPVVVEGPAREMLELLGREFVCECGGAPFTDGDRVRLTIERVEE